MNDETVTHSAAESEIQVLAREMRAGFAAVGRRFDVLEERMLEKADTADVNRGFDEVNRRFQAVDDQVATVMKRIEEEAQTTRRHFDVVAESMRDTIKVLAESQVHHGTVLDDHETRLKSLEKR